MLSGLMGAVLIGGFMPRDATYAAALQEGRPSLPSLLVSGAKDTLVPEERSRQLAETFEEGAVRFYLHPGGHMVSRISGLLCKRGCKDICPAVQWPSRVSWQLR